MRATVSKLYEVLGYTFNNQALLLQALSHRSARGENNERLEFLGDSIINFIIAEALFARCPDATEGQLSRLRANLVNGTTLAELAQEFKLGNYLRLGSGELKSGGFRRESILADAFEAIIAAIYLDSDIDVCKNCVLKWYQSRLDDLSSLTVPKDPKSELQEYLQARRLPLPHYEVTNIEGEAHQQIFYVQCKIDLLNEPTQASGASRRKAEQAAAAKILKNLSHHE